MFPNNRRFVKRSVGHWNLYYASGMDIVAAEKTVVKRKLNEDSAAFKTNRTSTIIGGTRRISAYFTSSFTS